MSKKRKLDGEGVVGGTVLFDFRDLSFSVPVRKKLRLEGLHGGIRALDAQGNAEVNISWESIGMSALGLICYYLLKKGSIC